MLSSEKGISYDCRRGFSSRSGSKRVAWMVTFLSGMSVSPGLWLEVGDGHVRVLQSWGKRVGVERERVLKELLVIPLWKIKPRVGAARFLPCECRERDRRCDLEHEVQLQRGHDLGVEGAARVLDLDLLEAFTQAAQVARQTREPVSRSKHPRPGIHLLLHLLADYADALVAALLLEIGGLHPARLVPEHRVDRIRRDRLGRGGVMSCRASCGGTEDQALGKRVRAQPVAAVQSDVGALAGGV